MSPTDEELLDLAERVGATFRASGRTLATAESCTGGLVAHLITEVPGSSAYFLGGLVTYADAVKTDLAEVPLSVLEAHGAVSAQVAVAMAEGPEQGLALLEQISLPGYHLLPATRADLLRRLERFGEAAAAYREALALVKHPAERRFLERRLVEVTTG